MISRLLFVHIPRTGGTSVESILRSTLDLREAAGYSDHVIARRPDRTIAHDQMFLGHQMLYIRDLVRPDYVVTILRDPVERIRSLWAFLSDRPEHARRVGSTLRQVAAEHAHAQDHQTRFLGAWEDVHDLRQRVAEGRLSAEHADQRLRLLRFSEVGPREYERARDALDSISLVGVFEQLAATVRLLCRDLGVAMPDRMPHEKAAGRAKAEAAPLTEDERRLILSRNRYDQELWHEATSRFTARAARGEQA